MRFESLSSELKSHADAQEGSRWNADKYDKFCGTFNAKGIAYTSYPIITNSASYFSRALGSMNQIRMHTAEALGKRDDCMDDIISERLLFDHTWTFKTIDNCFFIVSTPYSTWNLSKREFHKMQKKFPVTKNVEMYLIDNDLKFIENGDIMLVFIDWRIQRRYFAVQLRNGVGSDGRIITDKGIFHKKE